MRRRLGKQLYLTSQVSKSVMYVFVIIFQFYVKSDRAVVLSKIFPPESSNHLFQTVVTMVTLANATFLLKDGKVKLNTDLAAIFCKLRIQCPR